MLKLLDHVTLTAAKGIKSSDTTIMVTAASALKLNTMAIGDFTYFTLDQGEIGETVKYTHLAMFTNTTGAAPLLVERNVSGGGAKNFATPLCFGTKINGTIVQALIDDAMSGSTC